MRLHRGMRSLAALLWMGSCESLHQMFQYSDAHQTASVEALGGVVARESVVSRAVLISPSVQIAARAHRRLLHSPSIAAEKNSIHTSEEVWTLAPCGTLPPLAAMRTFWTIWAKASSLKPSMTELARTDDVENWNIRRRLLRAHRLQDYSGRYYAGLVAFFSSAELFEWFVFGAAIIVCISIAIFLQKYRMDTLVSNVGELCIWVAVGGVFMLLIWWGLGSSACADWLAGYLLEFVFAFENVFVFFAVVEAFQMPTEPTYKALVVVVVGQILFEWVFFMGLATPLRSFHILPYMLGLWLVYVGVQAARLPSHEEDGALDFKDTLVYKICQCCLGDRFLPYYQHLHCFVVTDKGKYAATLLVPAIGSLLLADFLLEVDVTLTKIEEIENHYIAFSSSALATMALPPLFFVARNLFNRFYLLQYGISFILIFFGGQMLFHQIITIGPIESVGIIIAVLLFCMIGSEIMCNCCQKSPAGQSHAAIQGTA